MPRLRAIRTVQEHDTDGSESACTPPSSDEHLHEYMLAKERKAARERFVVQPTAVTTKDDTDQNLEAAMSRSSGRHQRRIRAHKHNRDFINRALSIAHAAKPTVSPKTDLIHSHVSRKGAGQQVDNWSANVADLNARATSSTPQKEQRSVEEPMQAQFMSLSVGEETRALLPLLPTLDLVTKESLRFNDRADTETDTLSTQEVRNRRESRAELKAQVGQRAHNDTAYLHLTNPSTQCSSMTPANIHVQKHGKRYTSQKPFSTIQCKQTGSWLPENSYHDIECEHSEPDWYQNLLQDDNEVTQASSACDGTWGGCAGCSRCDHARVRGIATTFVQIEDPASTIRSYNTANHWLAAHPYRTAFEQSGTLSSVLREQSFAEKQQVQSSKQKRKDVVEQPTKQTQSQSDAFAALAQSDEIGELMKLTKGQLSFSEATDILRMCDGRLGTAVAMLHTLDINDLRLLLDSWREIRVFQILNNKHASQNVTSHEAAREQAITCQECRYGCDSCCSIKQTNLGNKCDKDSIPEHNLSWFPSEAGCLPEESAASGRGTTSAHEAETPEDGWRASCDGDSPVDGWGDTTQAIYSRTGNEVDPRSLFEQTHEPASTVETTVNAMQIGANYQWTTQQDQALLNLRSAPGKQSWSTTAKQVGMPVQLCKKRFKALKGNKKSSKSEKKAKEKKNAKNARDTKAEDVVILTQDRDPAFWCHYDDGLSYGISRDKTMEKPSSCWGSGGDDSAARTEHHEQAGGRNDDCWAIDDIPREVSREHSNGNEYQATDGWGWGDSVDRAAAHVSGLTPKPPVWASPVPGERTTAGLEWSNAEDASNAKHRHGSTTPTHSDPANKTYTVTYWATVESGDETVHIPIDSDKISGLEKTILNGPAKKVWKWIQEKGLGDKIGLQDAFDLAKDMQDVDQDRAKGSEEGEPNIHRSRAPSSSSDLPISAYASPPVRAQDIVNECHGCGWAICRCYSGKGDEGWGCPGDNAGGGAWSVMSGA